MGAGPSARALGIVAGIVLVVAACVSVALGILPGVPVLDGLSPPAAYHWVRPPPELRAGNRAPDSSVQRVPLGATGSQEASVSTKDEQVVLTLPAGAFPAAPGQEAVAVAIEPVDPAAAPAAPQGLTIQGNVYLIAVSYVPSGATATAVQPVDLVLRYPVDATEVILYTGGAWQLLPTTLESAALAVATTTQSFGLFAAAGTSAPRPRRIPAWAYLAAGIALFAAAAPTLLRRRRSVTRSAR
jgi:hypothetical protein